jgi:iron complex outermembrane recepter protein
MSSQGEQSLTTRMRYIGLVIATGCFTVPAVAFSDDESAAAVQGSNTPTSGIPEIVVTARKRSENSQDAPISLSVATAQDLENRSVRMLEDIQYQSTSLKFSPASVSPTSSVLSGRGQSVVDLRLATDPAIGVYLDGVYIPRTIGLNAAELMDLDRIEILNGPQGTLYGKNNTAGALNIFTNVPTHSYEGLIKVNAGNYGSAGVGGFINVPISPTLAVRAVGQYNYRNGYGTNTFDGTKFGRLDAASGRLSALWEPTESLTVTLRGHFSSSMDTGNVVKGPQFVAAGPSLITAEISAETGLSATDAAAAYRRYAGGNQNAGSVNFDPRDDVRVYGYSATLDWAFANNLSAKSITALHYIHRSGAVDFDGSPYEIFGYPVIRTQDRQLSQELQLSGNLFEDRLKFVLGGYYADENGKELFVQNVLGALTAAAGNTDFRSVVENQTAAAFAQGTFAVTHQFNVTGGVRYTRDKRFLTSDNQDNINCTTLGVSLAALAGAACTADFSATFRAPTYTLSLEYKPDRDILLYGRVDRGYRTGGLPENGGSAISPAAARLSYTAFKPEYAQNYEVGVKSQFFDRHAQLNLSAYNVIYSDLQRGLVVPVSGTNSVVTLVSNIAKAKVQGIEAEVSLRPVSAFELNGTLGYTHPEYISYVVNGVDLRSQGFVFTPKWSYSLSAAYSSYVGFGTLRAQIDYSWIDRMLASVPGGYQSAYGTLNGRLGLNMETGGYEAAIFAKNLTDKAVNLYALDVSSSLGAIFNGPTNQPRTFGVELVKRF